MPLPDYYRVLGISRMASPHEIKAAYRRLALRHHPDLHPNNPRAEEILKALNQAYDVLSDPQQRRQYDAQTAPARAATYAVPARPATPRMNYAAPRHPARGNRARSKIHLKTVILMWGISLLALMAFVLLLDEDATLPVSTGIPRHIELVLRTPKQALLFADSNGLLYTQEASVRGEYLGMGEKVVLHYQVQANQGRVFIGVEGQTREPGNAAPFVEGEWIEHTQSGSIEILIPQPDRYMVFLNVDQFAGTVRVNPQLE